MASRHPSQETRPLLEEPHTAYNTEIGDQIPPDSSIKLDKSAKPDLIWILAGLWSAVFLGALDGDDTQS